MTELADRVMLSPSGLTRRVDRLVARALVDRRACPSDGRGSLAVLTAPGWDSLRRAAPTHVAGVRRYLVDPITPEGIEQLATGLRAVAGALGDPGPARAGRAQAGMRRGRSQPGSGPVTTG
jgi:DNA-binding MarR family transcriptional regulator